MGAGQRCTYWFSRCFVISVFIYFPLGDWWHHGKKGGRADLNGCLSLREPDHTPLKNLALGHSLLLRVAGDPQVEKILGLTLILPSSMSRLHSSEEAEVQRGEVCWMRSSGPDHQPPSI